MKIVEILSYILRYELPEPIASSYGFFSERKTLLLELKTDEGPVGWGECHGFPEGARAVVEHALKPSLIGADPFDRDVIWRKAYTRTRHFGQKGVVLSAMSGVDIALWDLMGKAVGLPAHKLLGGSFRDKLSCYATGFFYRKRESLKALRQEAKGHLKGGFRAAKMKVGLLDIGEDVRRVAAVRETLGRDALLMVDANRGFNAESAIRLGRRLEPYDIFWLEEPVPPEDVEGYLEVKRSLRTLIAGGECEYTRWGFERLLSLRAVDVVQPETCAAGGLTECLKLASLAELYGIRYVPHYFGAGVALAAILQLLASLPSPVSSEDVYFPQVEWDASVNPLRDELLRESLSPREGVIEVPQGPGLGVEVRREVLERYGVA